MFQILKVVFENYYFRFYAHPPPPHLQKMSVGRSGPLHRLPLQATEWNRHTHFATIKTAGEELLTLSRNAEKKRQA